MRVIENLPILFLHYVLLPHGLNNSPKSTERWPFSTSIQTSDFGTTETIIVTLFIVKSHRLKSFLMTKTEGCQTHKEIRRSGNLRERQRLVSGGEAEREMREIWRTKKREGKLYSRKHCLIKLENRKCRMKSMRSVALCFLLSFCTSKSFVLYLPSPWLNYTFGRQLFVSSSKFCGFAWNPNI